MAPKNAKKNAKNKRAMSVAAAAKGTPIELDDDELDALEDAEGDDDEDEDEDEEGSSGSHVNDDEGESIFDKIARKIQEKGAREILLIVDREMPAKGPMRLPNVRVPAEKLDEIEDIICQRYGGTDPDGEYRVQVKASGMYMGSFRFKAEGAPVPVRYQAPADGSDELETEQPAGAPRSSGPLTAEAVAELIAKTLQEQKKADTLERLERENAELRARAAAAPVVKEDKTVSELTTAWRNLTDQAFRKTTEESPEMKAMKAAIDAQKLELEATRKELQSRKERATEEKLEDLKRLIRRGKKKKTSSASPILTTLSEMAAIDAMVTKMTRKEEEGESSGIFDAVVQGLRPTLEQFGKKIIKKLAKDVEASQRRRVETTQQEAGAIDPEKWANWLAPVLNNPALVEDADYVRQGLAQFGPHIQKLITVGDKPALVAFVTETLNEATAKQLDGASDEDVASALRTITVLRGTVVALAAQGPQKAAGPDDDEDDEDDEDTVDTTAEVK